MSRSAATPLIIALSPRHSDITRFRPWSPIATGYHLDPAEKIPELLRRLARLTLLIRVQAFRDSLRGELPHVQIFKNDGPNPLTWHAQLLSYWFSRVRRSSKISSWIWSIISGVVTVLGWPGRGASQVEKSPRLTLMLLTWRIWWALNNASRWQMGFNLAFKGLKWATQFLTMAYDGACSPNVSVRMAWISFGALPCRKEKLDDSSRIQVVEIASVAWRACFRPL